MYRMSLASGFPAIDLLNRSHQDQINLKSRDYEMEIPPDAMFSLATVPDHILAYRSPSQ